jgi:peptide/nickel transport system ATP-binding protein
MNSVPLLEASHLWKVYAQGRRIRKVALDDASLSLSRGSTVALVGKSGSGKSTLARCLTLLEKPDAGEVRLQGSLVMNLSRRSLRQVRSRVQLIWQHSALALNPNFRAIDLVEEPLRIQGAGPKIRREQALDTMSKLGLPAAAANRFPLQLSGGERQRVAIARALVQHPEIIIFDEPLAGLDIPRQLQIAKLLMELKAAHSLSYVFISHDLRMAVSLADSVAVMDAGKIVESQAVRDLLLQPRSNAARELFNTIPEGPFNDPGL